MAKIAIVEQETTPSALDVAKDAWQVLRKKMHPYGHYSKEEDDALQCAFHAAGSGRRQSCPKLPAASLQHMNDIAREIGLPVYFAPSGIAGSGRYSYAHPGHKPGTYEKVKQEMTMERLGRNAWNVLHQWAEEFKTAAEQAQPGCSCGDFAVSAVRGLHDAVNLEIGKPARYPNSLRDLSTFLAQACERLPRDPLGDPDFDAVEDDESDGSPMPSDLRGLVEEITPESALGEGIDDEEIILKPADHQQRQPGMPSGPPALMGRPVDLRRYAE